MQPLHRFTIAVVLIALDGEPTSVQVVGSKVIAAVNTSKSYTDPNVKLMVIDLASKDIELECALGGQPDSLALAKDLSLLAVAIENERYEDLNDGALPQLPAGYVTIFPIQPC